MNIVGTPYREVDRSDSTADKVASGLKDSAGTIKAAPVIEQHNTPRTQPKQ